MRANRILPLLGVALVVVVLMHDLDHVRQGRSLDAAVTAVGLVGLMAVLFSLALAVLRHRWAPAVSSVVGFGTAIGFVVVHIAPRWSAISDPYPDLPVDALSWASVAASVVIALAVGLAGVVGLSRPAVPA